MNMKPLTEFCTLNMGQSPNSKTYNKHGDGLPFYQGNADFGEVHPEARVWCSAPIKIAENGDILFSVRAPIGAMNMVVERCCIGRGLVALTPISQKCSKQFLYYALQSKVDSLIAQGTGSTFKAISKKVLEATIIPAYSIREQEQISKTIGRVDRAITARRSQLVLLDQLVKSRFIELFGDPIANQYGWEVTNIGEIVTEVRYGTSKPAVDGGRYSYLRMNNLTFDGHLDLKDLKYIDIPDEEIEKCIVRKGDVLFNRTNSVELVGKTCVFDLNEEMVIAGYIIRVRLGAKMLPIVFSAFMNSQPIKELLRRMAKGAVNQANINAQELQSIRIYVPPMKLQEQFANFVEQTDKSKYLSRIMINLLQSIKGELQ